MRSTQPSATAATASRSRPNPERAAACGSAQTPCANDEQSGIEHTADLSGRRPAMNDTSNLLASATAGYQLRFIDLYHRGRGYAFPCDAAGQVDLHGLSERGRDRYLHVQACVGTEYSAPVVAPAD